MAAQRHFEGLQRNLEAPWASVGGQGFGSGYDMDPLQPVSSTGLTRNQSARRSPREGTQTTDSVAAANLAGAWWADELGFLTTNDDDNDGFEAPGTCETQDPLESFRMAYERTEASAELLDRAREGGSHLAPIEVVFEACLAEPIRRTHTWLAKWHV